MFVTQTAFHPAYQGDSARAAALVRCFRGRGWYVAVAHLHDRQQVDADYAAMAERCDRLEVYRPTDGDLARRSSGVLDDWCPPAFAEQVAESCARQRIDVLVVQFVFLTRCFVALGPASGVLRVLDADNVFTGRAERYRAAGLAYDWFSTDAQQEREAFSRAELILAIQEEEERAIRRMADGVPVLLVPHVSPVVEGGAGEPGSLLFVGADNAENRAGLRRFVHEALPAIRARHPHARLRVAGRAGECLEPHPAVERLGVVPELSEWYRRSSIVLNTTACGTGLKIKTVEALCHGRCLVSTPAGVQGLERYGRAFVVAESPAAFAGSVSRLLDDPRRVAAVGGRAAAFARRYFSAERVLAPVERRLLRRAVGR